MKSIFLNPSYIVLDRNALQNNIRFLKSRGKKGLKISSVIKGNAYGHGISTYLPLAEEAGIDHFSVFSANEAEQAVQHRANPQTKIMIMGMIRNNELDWAIENDVEFYLFDESRLQAAITTSTKYNKRALVHLQVETGMNRTGYEESRWEELFQNLKDASEFVSVVGLCTHYAGAESIANYYRIQEQDKQLKKAIEIATRILGFKPKIHASSSAAFLTHPDKHYDMVRIGIAQYGFWPSRETYMHHIKSVHPEFVDDPLKRVLTWKSEIMSVKQIEGGDFIGYGNVYLAGKNMKIATVPIGYTHGFGRNLTNTGYVLVDGVRCGVVGLVNMNMITINVSHIEGVEKGDEVVIIGRQKEDEITLASFGEMTNHLNYEVLTRLPSTIPRLIE